VFDDAAKIIIFPETTKKKTIKTDEIYLLIF